MTTHRLLPVLAVAVCATLLPASSARAIDPYAFSLGLQGAAGGSLSGEPDSGLDNLGWQLGFSWQSELRTYVVVRLGSLSLEVDEGGGLFDSDLSWLTVAGEYRFSDAAWESGLFVGLGVYEESGAAFLEDDTAVGLTLGTTARFPVVERWDVVLELAGHFTDLDRAETFAVGSVGFSFSF